MDESKENDVDMGSVTESAVTVTEQEAGETLAEPMVCDGGEVGDGSLCEREVVEEGGSCHGEDIMVEVLGSDVFVDGVCTSGEDGIGENADEEAAGLGAGDDESAEEGVSEKEVKSLDGDNSGSQEIGASGSGEVPNSGTETQVEDSLGGAEEVVEKGGQEGMERGVEDSSAVVGCTSGETQVVVIEEVTEVVREEGVEEELVKEDVERDEGDVGSKVIEDMDSKEDGVLGDEVQNPRMENGVGESLVVEGSSGGETQVVVDKVSTTVVESVSYTIVGVKQDMEMVDKDGVLDDSEKQKVGIPDNAVVWNPGIETTVVCSSTVVESVTVHTQVFQEASEIVKEKDLNPEVDVANAEPELLDVQKQPAVGEDVAGTVEEKSACSEAGGMDTDAFDGSCLADKHKADVVVDGGNIEDHNSPLADPVSSAQTPEVVVDSEKHEESLDESSVHDLAKVKSSIAQAMEVDPHVTDAKQFGMHEGHEIEAEQLVNDQNLKDETVCRGSEIETAVSDRIEGIASNSNGETINPKVDDVVSVEKDRQSKSEECLDRNAPSDLAQLDSNIRLEREVQEQSTDAEEVSLCGKPEIEVKEQPIGGANEINVDAPTDPASLGQPAQVTVEGEVASMDVDALPDQNFEIQDSVSLDGMLPCSENDQNLKAETASQGKEVDNQVSDGGEMATMSNEAMNVNIESQGAREKASLQSKEVDNLVCDRGEMATMSNEAMNVNNESQGPGEKDQKFECLDKITDYDLSEVDSNMMQEMVAENQVTDAEHVLLHGVQEMEMEEQVADNEEPQSIEQKSIKQAGLKPGSSVQEVHYQLPAEIEGEFSVSDLVWGKVRSHPWWPGQVFDPSAASEKAMKYHKKDCFLVAYFGDRTFAWNEASLLKPFRTHFAQIQKQSNSEAFQNAVDCALEEVSRRIELGLACSCIPNDVYDTIKFQVVENTGIQEESSMRDGVDKSASANSFEPDKLVDFMKALALFPSLGADRLELVIAKAQLLAFYRVKGYCQLPEFQFCGALLESDAETLCPEDQVHLHEGIDISNPVYEDIGQRISETPKSTSHKRKHNLRDMYPIKKERSLTELMGGTLDSTDCDGWFDGKATDRLASPSAGKKRKTVDSLADDSMMQDGTKSISLAKVSNTTTVPKQSFKIGECIRRVASQLTGSPSIMKYNNDKLAGDAFGVSLEELEDPQGGSIILPTEYSSLDDLLSQLHFAAQDPLQGFSFLNIIVNFFCDFRNSVALGTPAMEKGGGKRKMSSHSIAGFPETFEFEDMNDSYWTDMVVQNGSVEQLSRKSRKGEYQLVPVVLEPDKSVQASRRPYSRKRYRDGNHELSAEAQALEDERKRASPAELILTFSEVNSVPSETNLSKMFRRFGPLKECETEIDRETSRARVVYKRGADAEVACSSAGKFNIFGPVGVTYQLNYAPFEPFKSLYTPSTEGLEEAALFLQSQS